MIDDGNDDDNRIMMMMVMTMTKVILMRMIFIMFNMCLDILVNNKDI